jgi:hypothetical protein
MGHPQLDAEVELDLKARMHSGIKRKARLIAPEEGKHQGSSKGRGQGSSSDGHGHGNAHKHARVHAAKHASRHGQVSSSGGDAVASISIPATTDQQQQQQQQEQQQEHGQQEQRHEQQPAPQPVLRQVSKLRCDVDVRLRVRVPPPLSAVPGPLLSTTGGLVAKLVMQALLPSFLDLLAVDYGRWASGDANRRSIAAGSLVPAAAGSSVGAVNGAGTPGSGGDVMAAISPASNGSSKDGSSPPANKNLNQ